MKTDKSSTTAPATATGAPNRFQPDFTVGITSLPCAHVDGWCKRPDGTSIWPAYRFCFTNAAEAWDVVLEQAKEMAETSAREAAYRAAVLKLVNKNYADFKKTGRLGGRQ